MISEGLSAMSGMTYAQIDSKLKGIGFKGGLNGLMAQAKMFAASVGKDVMASDALRLIFGAVTSCITLTDLAKQSNIKAGGYGKGLAVTKSEIAQLYAELSLLKTGVANEDIITRLKI